MVCSRVLGLALLLALGFAATAQAAPEDWALAGQSAGGDTFDLDLRSLTRNGDVVQGWLRQRFAKPSRDRASGQKLSMTLTQTLYDCKNQRWASGLSMGYAADGRQVVSGDGGQAWQDIRPGTVADRIAQTACVATTPLKDEAFLPDINAGRWLDLGLTTDHKSRLWVKMDRIVKADGDMIVFLSRNDYVEQTWMDGMAVTHVVQASALDCRLKQTAVLGSDVYIGASGRVAAVRVDPAKLAFEPLNAHSFLQNSYQSLCAAAVAPKAASEERTGASTGTAWGVAKGYLVTASHVIAGGGDIGVYADGELVGKAKVVADDPVNDVAVLKLEPDPKRRLLALPIASGAAVLGRPVFTLGYPAPDTMGAQIKMTAGQISSLAGVRDDARFLQMSAPIQPGNSGGPLIGWDGAVVGVVDSKLLKLDGEDVPPENVNYALKAAYIRPLLEGLPDLGNYTLLKPGLSHAALVAEAQRAVFLLLVEPSDE